MAASANVQIPLRWSSRGFGWTSLFFLLAFVLSLIQVGTMNQAFEPFTTSNDIEYAVLAANEFPHANDKRDKNSQPIGEDPALISPSSRPSLRGDERTNLSDSTGHSELLGDKSIHDEPIRHDPATTKQAYRVGDTSASAKTAEVTKMVAIPHQSLWQQRFGQAADNINGTLPRKYIFFKHIRKAGGTFLRNYLDAVRRYHPDAADPKGSLWGPPNRKVFESFKEDLSEDPNLVSFYEQEFSAMDWRCSKVDPRWNHTISITALREPMSRHLSEFFYSGLRSIGTKLGETRRGGTYKLKRHYQRGDFSDTFFDLLDKYIPLWMDGHSENGPDFVHQQFTNELQVRVLSGEAPLPPGNKSLSRLNLPCAYGTASYSGGTSAAGLIDDERLRKAQIALSRFDLVLITESMANQAEMVADMLGVPIQNASLARKSADKRLTNSKGKNSEMKLKLVDELAIRAPKAFQLLKNATKYESRLYKYAVTLSQSRFSQWEKERGNPPSEHSSDITTTSLDQSPAAQLQTGNQTGMENATKRPLTQLSLWKQRFHPDDATLSNNTQLSRKHIFFKHVRKAGGTFLRGYLDAVRIFHPDAADPRGKWNKKRTVFTSEKLDLSADPSLVSFYEQEFGALDWKCSEVDPRWNNTISVTALRDPISRQISEFFHSGIKIFNYGQAGKTNRTNREGAMRLTELYLDGNYTNEFYVLLDEYVPKWMDLPVDRPGFLGRHFTTDFQVKAFSGEISSKRQLGNMYNLPCAYGSAYGGGTSAPLVVDEEKLRRAQVALSKFDLVLITESMGSQAAMVADLLGVPLHNASLAETAGKPTRSSAGIVQKKVKLVEEIAIHAPNIFELLKNATQFESKFYDYAMALNQERFEAWKTDKKRRGTSGAMS